MQLIAAGDPPWERRRLCRYEVKYVDVSSGIFSLFLFSFDVERIPLFGGHCEADRDR